jgi:hypothetical protein
LFKALLYVLLTANAVYFTVAGTLSKAIDACAWLLLLALYEAELGSWAGRIGARQRTALHAVRLAAGAGVIVATVGYVFENNVLDALNSALWIAVVVLLEIEVRWLQVVERARIAFSAIAIALYGSLAALVLVWASRSAWIDAYDALLWLVAFAAIELNVLAGKTAGAAPATGR